MKNNISLSIELNKAIERVLRENYSLYKIERTEDSLLCLIDADLETGFYFKIISESMSKQTDPFDTSPQVHYIRYDSKPCSSTNAEAVRRSTYLGNLATQLKEWFNNIQFYQQHSILNDPIIKGYQKEFYSDFKFVDNQADFQPFSYDQQLLLDQFLENIVVNIAGVRTDRNSVIIDEIITDTLALQAELTTETKNGFMRKLSNIFAKARKGGLKICKFLLEEFAKEFLREGAKASFDFAINHSGEIAKYVKTVINLL